MDLNRCMGGFGPTNLLSRRKQQLEPNRGNVRTVDLTIYPHDPRGRLNEVRLLDAKGARNVPGSRPRRHPPPPDFDHTTVERKEMGVGVGGTFDRM